MDNKFRKPCSCRSGVLNGAFRRMRASLEASVMDLCTPQKVCGLGANELLFGQNESANFTKMLIFTICQRDTRARRGQVGPAGPPPPAGKKYPVGGAAHPPLQQSDSCPQAPGKMATPSFSASALAWDVPGTHLAPCVLWLLGPPGRPHGPLQGGCPMFLR